MGDEPGTGVEPAAPGGKRDAAWWQAHPEERVRQSERAKALIAEGKLSGKAGYGRRKRRPAYEVTAAKAAVNAQKIADELINQALNSEKISERQNAIKLLFESEHRVRQETRDQEDHLMRLAGDELTQELLLALREVTGIDEFYDAESEAFDEDDESVGDAETQAVS